MVNERQIPLPESIKEKAQLLVEGRSDEEFFRALFRNMKIDNGIQIYKYGGKDYLRRFLESFKKSPGFENVVSLGIVRDADNDPESAFKSVCTALQHTGLYKPKKPESFEGSDPRVGALILPDSKNIGMLETLCMRSVIDDNAIECVDEYFSCIQKQLGYLPKTMDKAKTQAFMASRPETVWQLGEASQKGYFNLNHSAFDHVKLFIHNLIK